MLLATALQDVAMADAITATMQVPRDAAAAFRRLFVIGVTSFLTLVDLFAAQAILPTLTKTYGVTPAAMGFAVNASTIGMAVAGVAIALFGRRINRRLGICAALVLLAIPTTLLAMAPDLASFTALRIAQGLFMSSAFTLTMAYLAEQSRPAETAGALAAYITGNVASNLFGRLISASLADMLGLAPTFYFFALLNLAGALLVYHGLSRCQAAGNGDGRSMLAAWAAHFRNPALRAAFGIGFIILFAFIGIFTYVNFVLARAPIALPPMALGFIYLVFVPSLLTTPLAGPAVRRFGTRPTFWATLAVAGGGLPLLLRPSLAPVLAGLVLVGAGTFFAQAAATGFVSRAATEERGAASGIYLASYYLGGLAGSAILGQVFDRAGWAPTVAAIGVSLAVAAVWAFRLKLRET
jgi:predicted MFS family arabinose efflux permease